MTEPLPLCARCGTEISEDDEKRGSPYCSACDKVLAAQEAEDRRLDSPEHGQARSINRRIE